MWYFVVNILENCFYIKTHNLIFHIINLKVVFVGEEGLEPPVSQENGFTIRAATNYRLLSQAM